MSRVPRYSSSGARRSREVPASVDPSPPQAERSGEQLQETKRAAGGFPLRGRRPVFVMGGVLVAAAAALAYGAVRPEPESLTQRDIDQAVLHTLENLPAEPSAESRAYEIVRPSIVHVRWRGADPDDDRDVGAGTGVVIVDDGTILTNLHVVAGADRIEVTFADGTESEAELVSVQPDQDLAVIRATTLPDDLVPATLRSTNDLRIGDRVVAVGFPFGIGPSLSSGVVSGLQREYRSPEGDRLLTDLIQFDAAANPGNSGGPLVTEDGQVVGIVTAILNPANQRVFIGIGFAVPIETAAASVGSSPF